MLEATLNFFIFITRMVALNKVVLQEPKYRDHVDASAVLRVGLVPEDDITHRSLLLASSSIIYCEGDRSQERDDARAEFLASSREALVALRTALVSGKWEKPREREVISTVATFACGEVEWTTDELREIAVSAIDCLGSSTEQLVLRELLLEIHASLRHGTREAAQSCLYEGNPMCTARPDILLKALLMTSFWRIKSLGYFRRQVLVLQLALTRRFIFLRCRLAVCFNQDT
ncbi:hypothetical protein SELMODRAFT_423537 [Selaginella moellendorffii]|uniref:Uncharacterized protein n=1 Tax=Selaginella moellendorffii TaxID=88036 RepID=D8SM09_SELML|nr:hypothetical protein SELMODRAFT_423537 [Selaginella moellendorffii]